MISDTEVKRGWLELDFASCKFSPLVSGSIQPSNEIKVIHVLKGSEIGALKKMHKLLEERGKCGICTHLADATETRPSFGPSFSRITECDHLSNYFMSYDFS